MAFTATAALVAGAEASATLVLGAMTEIGTAMTIVGAVTGEKSLMKIGGVLSIVGGVGGMINGAVSAGAATAAGGEVTGAAVDASGIAADATDVTNAGAVNGVDSMSDAFTQGGSTGAGGFEGPAAVGDVSAAADDANTSMQDFVGNTNAKPGVDSGVVTKTDAPTAGAPQAPAAPTTSSAAADTAAGYDPAKYTPVEEGFQGTSAVTSAATAPETAPDYFGKFLSWVKENKEVSNGVLKLGMGVFKGLGDKSMQDQKLAQQQSQFNTLYSHANDVAAYRTASSYSPTSILQQARGG